MKAWHKLLGLSIATSSLVVGCVVGSDDGSGGSGGFGAEAGTAGTAGSGGTTGGTGGGATGVTTGGTGGTTGGTGGTTGGTGGMATGGTGGTSSFMCDMTLDPTAGCDECAQVNCCTAWEDCVNDPSGSCLSGASTDEMACIIMCTDDVYTQNSAVTSQDVANCAAGCGPNGTIASAVTLDLVQCLEEVQADSGGETACGLECFSMF